MLAFLPLLALPAIMGPTANQFGVSNAQDEAAGHGAEGAAAPLITLVDQLPNWAVTSLTLAIVAGFGLGGCEAYPGVFGVFAGFADDAEVENGMISLSDRPGIGFEAQNELYAVMRKLS